MAAALGTGRGRHFRYVTVRAGSGEQSGQRRRSEVRAERGAGRAGAPRCRGQRGLGGGAAAAPPRGTRGAPRCRRAGGSPGGTGPLPGAAVRRVARGPEAARGTQRRSRGRTGPSPGPSRLFLPDGPGHGPESRESSGSAPRAAPDAQVPLAAGPLAGARGTQR